MKGVLGGMVGHKSQKDISYRNLLHLHGTLSASAYGCYGSDATCHILSTGLL